MDLSKNQIKLINSLDQKKQRMKQQLFVAEGVKVVKELLESSFELEQLYVTSEMVGQFQKFSFLEISEISLKKVTSLKSPNGVLALFKMSKEKLPKTKGLIVVLDAVNDPGNLGTIIRLCDWFGIQQLVCSTDTVDCYNSKVIQATMGSLSRVQINYLPLKDYLLANSLPKYCADMDGVDVYKTLLPKEGLLVMGNEANGISAEIKKCCSDALAIPRFGDLKLTESLNVANATAILLSEFKRG